MNIINLEKIPITIPKTVNNDRSLFAFKELKATFTVSQNLIIHTLMLQQDPFLLLYMQEQNQLIYQ